MKLLFVHDTKFKEDNNGTFYTDGSFSDKVWERYLSVSTELSVLARKEQLIYDNEIAKKSFNYFDKENINFIEVPDLYTSIADFVNIQRRKKLYKKIKEAVLDTDLLIARLPSTNGNIAVYFAKRFNKPYLVEVVGCSWDSFGIIILKGNYLRLYFIINRRMQLKKVSMLSM